MHFLFEQIHKALDKIYILWNVHYYKIKIYTLLTGCEVGSELPAGDSSYIKPGSEEKESPETSEVTNIGLDKGNKASEESTEIGHKMGLVSTNTGKSWSYYQAQPGVILYINSALFWPFHNYVYECMY